MNIPNPSPNWTPEERLQVILAISEERKEVLSIPASERVACGEFLLWITVSFLSKATPAELETHRTDILSYAH